MSATFVVTAALLILSNLFMTLVRASPLHRPAAAGNHHAGGIHHLYRGLFRGRS